MFQSRHVSSPVCLLVPGLLLVMAGVTHAKFDFPLNTVRTHHQAITVRPAPEAVNGKPVTWYQYTFIAEKDYTVDGVKLKKGESITGIGSGDWPDLKGNKPAANRSSWWIIPPRYADIDVVHQGLALVRAKREDSHLSYLNIKTRKLTRSDITRIVLVPTNYRHGKASAGFPWLARLTDLGPGEYAFMDENGQPSVTIGNVLSFRGFRGGAIAVEHRHPEESDKRVLIIYNRRGKVITPPITEYRFVRIGAQGTMEYPVTTTYDVCLLPVDVEQGLYWPVANTGHPVPVPEGAIGLKLIEQSVNQNREPVLGAAVLWDTPDGPRYALISNRFHRFYDSATLAASRSEAKWTDFRFSAVRLGRHTQENVFSYGGHSSVRHQVSHVDCMLVMDEEQSVFVLPWYDPRPWDEAEAAIRSTPYRGWNDALAGLRSYNDRVERRKNEVVAVRAEELRKHQQAVEAHRAIQAQKRRAAEEARNAAALPKVMQAIRTGRLNTVSYDDMRHAYQAEKSEQGRKQIDDAFRSKQKAEEQAAARQQAAAARYNYSPYGSGSSSQSIQSSWQRHTASQAQAHWNNQLRNYERDRSFDAVRRAAGYPQRN